jgi:predicted 3-demethylubiquinone-9 3-methyltransferase (glyoxalase superfamily)
MRRTALFALTASICIATAAQAAPTETTSASPAFSTAITAQGFRAYDKAISSDAMDGRKPGAPGGARAVAWIIDQFKTRRQLAGGDAWPPWYADSAFRAKRVEMMKST